MEEYCTSSMISNAICRVVDDGFVEELYYAKLGLIARGIGDANYDNLQVKKAVVQSIF